MWTSTKPHNIGCREIVNIVDFTSGDFWLIILYRVNHIGTSPIIMSLLKF